MILSEIVKGIFEDKKGEDVNSMPNLTDDGVKVRHIHDEFEEALEFEQERMEENSEAWKLYSGHDYGQYDDKVKNTIKKEGRNPFQGNFIRSKVNGLAGALIKNFQDVDYEPIDGNQTDTTRMAKELMYSDKELLDWESSDKDATIDGLVYVAVEEMYISDRYNPLGNIGFKRVMPGHIILDPNWLSNNSWDLKRCWKVAYMTVEEIKQKYKTTSERIDTLALMKATTSTFDYDNGDDEQGFPHYQLETDFGDKYRVIEYHHIEPVEQTIEIDAMTGLTVPDVPEDREQWMEYNNVNPENIIERKVSIDCYYVTTICPTLAPNTVLEDKKSNIQIGRLPFFIWSSARINGRNSGIPALLKSVQQTYNKRESMLDHMISTSANGAKMIDPDIVDSNSQLLELLKKNINNPAFVGITAPGALASGRNYFQEVPRTQMDYGVVNEINRMLDMSDRISNQPAASDARSEGSEESGVLFARKQLQAEITQTVLSSTRKQYWNEKGEAYLLLAKILYSGVYRTFKVFGEDRVIEINKPIITPTGEVVENDISQLPRMKVVVTQSPEGITQRTTDRIINTELLRVIDQSHPLARAMATKNVMKTLGNSKVEKQELERAAELEQALAEETIKTQILDLRFKQVQIGSRLQQMQGPRQPQGPQLPNPQQAAQSQGAGNPGANVEGNTKQAIQIA